MRKTVLVAVLLIFLGFTLQAAPKTKLNFNDVEVLSVIKLMSKATGRSFVFNSNILKGKRITLLSNEQFTPDEAYRIFEAVLNINGLATIEEGKVVKIISKKDAKIASVPVYDEKSKIRQGSFITRVIPIKHGKIRTIRSNLAPLVSRDAILIAIEDAKALILKDTKENTERFADIVALIDQEEKEIKELNLELVPLKYADSGEMAGLVGKIFSKPVQKDADPSQQFKIFADKRTNNLILIGAPGSLQRVKLLITELDKNIEKDEGNIRVFPLKSANAKTVSEVLQKISGTLQSQKGKKDPATKATIIPDIPSNSLVIYADKADFPALENVINKLDIERAQVYIQAVIMEVTLTRSRDLGVEWQASDIRPIGGKDAVVTIGGVGSTGTPSTLAAAATNTSSAGAVVGVIGGTITYGGTQYASMNAFIKASETDSEIDILSNPQILTLNNEEAEIKVGSIIPTIGATKTDANGNTTTTIDYKEVGVSLKITPQINVNDSIELKIDKTTSNVITGTSDALSNQGAITTLNRSLKTKVAVDDGQIIVLGGQIADDITQQQIKTPCLGDIPIVGWLFKTESTNIRKTNLLIFLSPKVVRDEADLKKVTDEAKKRYQDANQGRFRINVSKEFNLPLNDEELEEKMLEESEEQEPTETVE